MSSTSMSLFIHQTLLLNAAGSPVQLHQYHFPSLVQPTISAHGYHTPTATVCCGDLAMQHHLTLSNHASLLSLTLTANHLTIQIAAARLCQ